VTTVVGIAGVAGAGKSTLVRELLARWPGSSSIHVDHYQRITRQPVAAIVEWMERGADFDEFQIPVLGEHLQRLKAGEAVLDPLTLARIEPLGVLLFETHFGRAHRATGSQIDLMVWIETPLDVALARNVAAMLVPMRTGSVAPTPERLNALDGYLQNYLRGVRRLAAFQRERLRADADITLDGLLPPSELAEAARRAIAERLP
jgi:uridine kinase